MVKVMPDREIRVKHFLPCETPIGWSEAVVGTEGRATPLIYVG